MTAELTPLRVFVTFVTRFFCLFSAEIILKVDLWIPFGH